MPGVLPKLRRRITGCLIDPERVSAAALRVFRVQPHARVESRAQRRDLAVTAGAPRFEHWLRAGTWDSERVLSALRAWEAATGFAPRAYEWNPCTARHAGLLGPEASRWEREWPRWPSHGTVARYFGSFGEGLLAAGLAGRRRPGLPLDERVGAARRLSAEGLGAAEIADLLELHPRTVRRYLRSGDCRGCGTALATTASVRCPDCARHETHTPSRTREQVIAAVGEWTADMGRPPTKDDWRLGLAGSPNRWEREWPRWPSAGQALVHFESWEALLRAVGSKPNRRFRWSDQEILAALRRVAEREGRPPTEGDWQANGVDHPNAGTVKDHFGSWRAGLAAAGLACERDQWDRERILEAIRRFARRHGRPPSSEEWQLKGPQRNPTAAVVRRHFGSFTAALAAAGFEPHWRPFTDDEALLALRAYFQETGRPPTVREWNKLGRRPSAGGLIKRFGSWNAALDAAGVRVARASPHQGRNATRQS